MINFEPSTQPVAKHLKVLLWGASGTRKTETPLRFFPACAVVDTEGGTDLCRGMPEIPPFVALKTADIYDAIDAVEAIVAGKVKLPDGGKVQTIVIDSMSVLWHVRQEAGQLSAEARASRRAKGRGVDPDTVDMSFHDWGKAKRPIRQLMHRLNAIPFHVVITARQKDEFAKRPGAASDQDLVKVGETFDAEKNLDYDVDLAFQCTVDREGRWSAAVTKVRGILGRTFAVGARFTAWPAAELLAAAPAQGPIGAPPSQPEAARANLRREQAPSMAGLIAHAEALGVGRPGLKEILAAAGITAYQPARHAEMLALIDAALAGHPPASPPEAGANDNGAPV